MNSNSDHKPDLQSAPQSADAKHKDAWDKADIVGKLLGSILIPVGVAIAGIFVNLALQERTLKENVALQERIAKQKTAEIAVTVLQSKDTTIPGMKEWARGVFNEMLADANHRLPPAAVEELNRSPLPSSSNASGADVVAEFEGVHLVPFQDVTGVWTIGFGHTEGVGPNSPPITLEQAKQFLVDDLKKANEAIDSLVSVPLSPNQKEALVSFVWNVGVGNFGNVSLDVPNRYG